MPLRTQYLSLKRVVFTPCNRVYLPFHWVVVVSLPYASKSSYTVMLPAWCALCCNCCRRCCYRRAVYYCRFLLKLFYPLRLDTLYQPVAGIFPFFFTSFTVVLSFVIIVVVILVVIFLCHCCLIFLYLSYISVIAGEFKCGYRTSPS